jgi:hypothetical protein
MSGDLGMSIGFPADRIIDEFRGLCRTWRTDKIEGTLNWKEITMIPCLAGPTPAPIVLKFRKFRVRIGRLTKLCHCSPMSVSSNLIGR